MKLTHAQKVFLKFAAKSQLYVALAVLVTMVYGVAVEFPWEIHRFFVLGLFLTTEAIAIYYMVKLHRRIAALVSNSNHDSPQE